VKHEILFSISPNAFIKNAFLQVGFLDCTMVGLCRTFFPFLYQLSPPFSQKVSCMEQIKFAWERGEPKHFINYK